MSGDRTARLQKLIMLDLVIVVLSRALQERAATLVVGMNAHANPLRVRGLERDEDRRHHKDHQDHESHYQCPHGQLLPPSLLIRAILVMDCPHFLHQPITELSRRVTMAVWTVMSSCWRASFAIRRSIWRARKLRSTSAMGDHTSNRQECASWPAICRGS